MFLLSSPSISEHLVAGTLNGGAEPALRIRLTGPSIRGSKVQQKTSLK